MIRHELHELWVELDSELQLLRAAFDDSSAGVKALGWFDEHLSANEFGLALETLCDFLLAADTRISPGRLLSIQRLHEKMGVDDNCVINLRQKSTARR